MKKPVRLILFLLCAIAGFAGAVYLYYLPLPKPTKEIDYRDIVRRVSFVSPSSLKEWEEKKLSKNKTAYTVEEDDGRMAVKAVSESGASGLYLKEKLSFRDRPFVKWKWKAVKFPVLTKKEDLASKKEFDFAAQFYVLFYSRMIMNSRAIQYVWAQELPEGTSARSPYTDNVKMLVLQTGESEEWRTEERDIASDYFELFGKELDKDVVAVAFMTDADSTGTYAEAWFADIELGYLPISGVTDTEEEGAAAADSK